MADLKERLRDDLDERYPALLAVIDDALVAKKRIPADVICKHCKKASRPMVEVSDVDAAIRAAQFMTEHGHGKPGVSTEVGDSERVVFYRVSGDAAGALQAAEQLWGAEKRAELATAMAAPAVPAR